MPIKPDLSDDLGYSKNMTQHLHKQHHNITTAKVLSPFSLFKTFMNKQILELICIFSESLETKAGHIANK